MKGTYQLLIVLLQSIQLAQSLICLSCTSANSPTDCATVERCGPLSECYMDLYATSTGELRFSLGCRDIKQCTTSGRKRRHHIDVNNSSRLPYQQTNGITNTSHRYLHGGTIGTFNETRNYRRRDTLVCSQCCNNGELCNHHGCGQTGYTVNHGPICYNCDQQTGTTSCNIIKVCGRDEMCYIEEITITDVTLYHTKCMGKLTCNDQNIVMTSPVVVNPVVIGRDVPQSDSTGIETFLNTFKRYSRVTQGCCVHSLCNTYLPQNGNWGPWMSWSGCSTTCGFNGVQKRTRYCVFPPPKLSGRGCEGNDVEIDTTCANKPCSQGMVCLSCSSSIYPRTCNYVETCGPNSVCYLERYVTRNGDTRFKTGCRDVHQCSNGVRHGKRFLENGDILSCAECCHGNLCNSHGCDSHPYPPDSGPVCYSCDQQSDPQHCNKIDICKQGQKCGLKKLPFIDVIYQTMCLDPVQCLSDNQFDDVFPKCCTTSLCEFKEKPQPNTTPACVSPSITSIEKSGDIIAGNIISLTCHNTGIPTPNVTWMVFKDREDGADIINDIIYITLDQHMLGAYKCIASNNCGYVEQNFTISYIAPHT